MKDKTEQANTTDAMVSSDDSLRDSFADGDLGRIQGILFGDQARKVDERLNTLEAALLGALADLRNELHTSFETLEQKLGAEADTRAKAMKNMGERLNTEAEIRSEGEAAIQNKIDSTETAIRHVISTEREAAAADVERELSALRSDAVDREDLAELFATTAERLRGNKSSDT